MVKIANYWTADSPLRVRVYSNCEQVELLLNGESVAKQKPVPDDFSSRLDFPPFVFNIGKFQPGILTANAFIDGEVVAADSASTPGQAAAIRLVIDLSEIPINPEYQDAVFVYARIVDANGTLIPVADDFVDFILDGDAELIGDNPAQAKAGVATILLQTQGLDKPIVVKAFAGNLKAGKIEIDRPK